MFFLDCVEKDELMARVDLITLSYTLFAPPSESWRGALGHRAGPAGRRLTQETTDAAVP